MVCLPTDASFHLRGECMIPIFGPSSTTNPVVNSSDSTLEQSMYSFSSATRRLHIWALKLVDTKKVWVRQVGSAQITVELWVLVENKELVALCRRSPASSTTEKMGSIECVTLPLSPTWLEASSTRDKAAKGS
eukprot:scaffold270091_cov49-Attheya_sp.AAC.3